MQFEVDVPNTMDALGVPVYASLFPMAHSIEIMHTEPYELTVRVTYCHGRTKCVNACTCGAVELPKRAAEAIIKAWPDQADAIFQDIRPALGGYFGFRRWGMYVGVEDDGYIHT